MNLVTAKVKSRQELADICVTFRQQGRRIGFTSGVFDLLHAGHVDYLEQARSTCDVLIVGINSDTSVQKYKGQGRPVIPQDQRAKVVAALEPVTFVFIFDERRNAKNIELLKPDYYIKAGDYQKSQLTSKEIVEQYGGQILLIPIKEQISTSAIINKLRNVDTLMGSVIETRYGVHFYLQPEKIRPAIFLDRDGTINKEVEYLHEPEKFELLPGVGAGLRKLQDLGYRLVIVTNQAGIGLGYFTTEDFYRVNRKMFKELAAFDVKLDRIYFCPHNVTDKCRCRKPDTGLIERAQSDLKIDLTNSYIIGDKTEDIELGQRSGIKTILVKTGHAGRNHIFTVTPDCIAENLEDAVTKILQIERNV